MCVCPPRDSSQDEATGQDGVSRICKSFFDADERNIQKISEQMKAEEYGRKVGREEAGEENGERMVVMRCQ